VNSRVVDEISQFHFAKFRGNFVLGNFIDHPCGLKKLSNKEILRKEHSLATSEADEIISIKYQ
jgi:hypothetical protein